MKRLLIAAAALALALPGCAGFPATPPAPLSATAIDEKALTIGWQAFDLALVAVDGLIIAGLVKPGSEAAAKLDAGIEAVQTALNAATAARAALSAGKDGAARDYSAAMADAQAAFTGLQSLLKGFAK